MLDNYEININTLAIIPVDSKMSKILEGEDIFFINKRTTDIIDYSCKYFGSSYIGRLAGTKNLINVNYKSPIVIEETNDIIFFPTSSPRFNDCTWLALNNIKNYIKSDNNCKIIFKNNVTVDIKISLGSLQNQILRSTML